MTKNNFLSKLNKTVAVIGLLTLLSTCVAGILFPANALAEKNTQLLQNGNFEDNDGKSASFWTFNSWQDEGNMAIDKSVSRNGSASVRIENRADEPSDSRIHQVLNVEPQTLYLLTCWVKTKDVANVGYGANISFTMSSVNMSVEYPISNQEVATTNGWKKLSLYFKTDTNMTSVEATIGLGGYSSENSGTIWIDDASLKKVDSVKGDNKIFQLKSPASASDTDSQNNDGSSSMLWLIILIVIVVAGIIAAVVFIPSNNKNDDDNDSDSNGNKVSKDKSQNTNNAPNKKATSSSARTKTTELQELLLRPTGYNRLKLEWKDYVIMAIATVIYAVVAFTNLGSLHVPQTGWVGTKVAEQQTFELSEPVSVAKVGVYYGYGAQKINVKYQDESGKYVNLCSIDKEASDLWKWEFFTTNTVTAKRFKVITETATNPVNGDIGGTFNELAFFDSDDNAISLANATIVDEESDSNTNSSFTQLFDEQEYVQNYASYYTGTYFDEIYHPRTAFENMYDITVYEWTHPPLGKYIMTFGIRLFGMTPFGWRFMGTLFGVLMIPLMYLFAMKLFKKKRFWAFCAMWLMCAEFMHFSLTRIATIDSYVTFFIILMYYFMYDYYVNTSVNMGFKKSLSPLALCGIAFGLGAASKWIGIYAGGGLAVLFFVSKYEEFRRYSKAREIKQANSEPWIKNFFNLYIVKTCLLCVLFFVVVPLVIYVASYIPTYFDVNPDGIQASWDTIVANLQSGEWLKIVVDNQKNMLGYHGDLDATHHFSSEWYQWPMTAKPLFAFRGENLPGGAEMNSTIDIMGNPAIFWMGVLAFPFAIYYAIKNKERGMTVVLIAMAFQFIPWMLVDRCLFIYHYFSTTPFMIFALVYVLKNVLEPYGKNGMLIAGLYLLICTVLFVMFYPVLSGLEVPKTYVQQFLQWFPGVNKDAYWYWIIT